MKMSSPFCRTLLALAVAGAVPAAPAAQEAAQRAHSE
jgi:hypothetical protein